MVSDNGPQFASSEMKKFAVSYKFEHVTSSPRYPQGNGLAERAMQTMKKMLTAKDDVDFHSIHLCHQSLFTSNIHIRSLPYSMTYIIIIGL